MPSFLFYVANSIFLFQINYRYCSNKMVYYFICEIHDPPLTIYLGEDKFVNEELIRYGFPEDIWFHVDGVSSAHVYLRLPSGMGLDDIPQDVLIDCAQLTKANSISGCKQDSVKVDR